MKCRYCDWERPPFRTNKKGKRCSTYPSLVAHVIADHPEIADKYIFTEPEEIEEPTND